MFLIFVHLLRPIVTGPDRGTRRGRRREIRCGEVCSDVVPEPSMPPLSALPVMVPPFAAPAELGGLVAPPFAVDWLFDADELGAAVSAAAAAGTTEDAAVSDAVAAACCAAGFRADGFFAVVFWAAGFFAAVFFAAGLLAVDFFGAGALAAELFAATVSAAGGVAAARFAFGAAAAVVVSAAEISGVLGVASRAIAFPSIEDGCQHPCTGVAESPKRDATCARLVLGAVLGRPSGRLLQRRGEPREPVQQLGRHRLALPFLEGQLP